SAITEIQAALPSPLSKRGLQVMHTLLRDGRTTEEIIAHLLAENSYFISSYLVTVQVKVLLLILSAICYGIAVVGLIGHKLNPGQTDLFMVLITILWPICGAGLSTLAAVRFGRNAPDETVASSSAVEQPQG
ncbi:hypothetical protein, partial [Marinimicrobium sp. ABcell2]|uniref:hypothetical protein n=1 Tax=Marinimicrobium sp. ABcell2 TaxID=3069751 RepID=UPI0027B7F821